MEKNISLHLLCGVIRERRVAMSNARPHQYYDYIKGGKEGAPFAPLAKSQSWLTFSSVSEANISYNN